MHQFITLLCSGHCPLCHLVTFDDQARPGQGDCCLVLLWDIDSVVRLSLKRRGWHFPLRCVSVLSHWTHCIAQTFDLLITLLTHVWFAYYIAQTFGLLITLLTRLICSQFLYFSFYYQHWLSTRHLSPSLIVHTASVDIAVTLRWNVHFSSPRPRCTDEGQIWRRRANHRCHGTLKLWILWILRISLFNALYLHSALCQTPICFSVPFVSTSFDARSFTVAAANISSSSCSNV